MQNHHDVKQAAAWAASRLEGRPAATGLVFGSGLGGPAKRIRNPQRLACQDIPGFPRSTVAGHEGVLVSGLLGQTPVTALCGRLHLYEGRTPDQVVMGVRLLRELGVERLIVTNAAGALNPLFAAGRLMLIADHVNMTGRSPLTGANHEPWGLRFPDMSAAYSKRLRGLALKKAAELGLPLHQGVYFGVAGPQLETPAETRMLRALGADAVGMSTVLETIAAVHMGMEVLGISCLTNQNLPDCMRPILHEDVLATAAGVEEDLGRLLEAVCGEL